MAKRPPGLSGHKGEGYIRSPLRPRLLSPSCLRPSASAACLLGV